ncbi:MAG TPA: hypothetical protein VFE84_01885, partial [Patescibacteria group bacterium]|nr:hypothetical protein [Patescibacteria group bacterium]
ALVVAGAALGILFTSRAEPPAEFRGSPENVFGSVTPPGGAVVAPDDLAFSWQPVPAADRYDLEVSNATGETLLSLQLGADVTSARWPSDRPRPPRGALIWKLRARALDRVVAETRPIPFEIQ